MSTKSKDSLNVDKLVRVIEYTTTTGIKVTRMRSSEGRRHIKISHCDYGSLEFKSTRRKVGDNYEQAAKDFAAALDEIANEPCLLDAWEDKS